MTSDEQAIHTVHTTWIAAVNAGDLACLLALMTDDVVYLGPGREPFGRDAFGPGLLGAHEHNLIHCLSDLEEVVVVGELAHTRCRDSLTVTPRAGGATVALAGHRLTVYRRQADGRWLLARDAHTLMPVAA
jgi:uncharacterized protein (TIGR02246 family)